MDLEHFKKMIRSSNREAQDSLNRSQDFLGGSMASNTLSPRNLSPRNLKTSPRAGTRYNSKSDDWLGGGSPSPKKSYSIKTKSSPVKIAPPGLDSSDRNLSEKKLSSSHRNNSVAGVTRHTLGASSSHHQSGFAVDSSHSQSGERGTNGVDDDGGTPDPEKYKQMIRESMHSHELNLSQEFVGAVSPVQYTHRSQRKALGKNDSTTPISPERPSGWLSPTSSSPSKKSYNVKDPSTGGGVAPIPNLTGQAPSTPKSATTPSRKPFKSQSLALGSTTPALSPKSNNHNNTNHRMPSGKPVKSRSMAIGEQSPYMTPQERVDRKKFVAAFTTFEKVPQLPTALRGVSPVPNGKKRNFTIRNSAIQKELALSDTSNHSMLTDATDEIQFVLTNLRKVAIAPQEGMTDEEKREWVGQQLEGDTAMNGIFNDMLEKGLISTNLGPNRMEMIRKAIEELEKVHTRENGETKQLIGIVLRQHLLKLTSTSSGAVYSIQQALARLKKVRSQDKKTIEGVEGVSVRLRAVISSMIEGQKAEFLQAFEKMEKETSSTTGGDKQEETRKQQQDALETKDRARISAAKKRFRPQDAHFLVNALANLRKTKMNRRQSALAGQYVRTMKPIESKDSETKVDEDLAKLGKRIGSKRREKIIAELKSLHRVRLNEPERADLAEVVRGLGTRKMYKNEIGTALMKLKRIKMTPREAKEAAGIMFNLRKAMRGNFDLATSREMANLRKVMAPESVGCVAAVFSRLCEFHLDEKEIDQFAGTVAEMGVEELQPDDFQLMTMEYVDGNPVLVLNIPYGDDYADDIESLDMDDFIQTKSVSETRVFKYWIDLDRGDEESSDEETERQGDSDFEAESDDEEEQKSPSKRKKKRETQQHGSKPPLVPESSPKHQHSARNAPPRAQKNEYVSPVSGRKKVEDAEPSRTPPKIAKTAPTSPKSQTQAFPPMVSPSLSEMYIDNRSRSEDSTQNCFPSQTSPSRSPKASAAPSSSTTPQSSPRRSPTAQTSKSSPRRPPTPQTTKSSPGRSPTTQTTKSSPGRSPTAQTTKLHHFQHLEGSESPMTEEKAKKIRFTNKPQWRHKKHNVTVVSEKRWRFEENFNADEVIWSPLSRDQYDRRKTVGAAILKTMDKFAPMDDMLLDEFEKDNGRDNK